MAGKKSYDDRINEALAFIEAEDFSSAISTMKKAKNMDPVKAETDKLDDRISEYQKKLDEVTEDTTTDTEKKPEETTKSAEDKPKTKKKTSGDPDEPIDFVIDDPVGVCVKGVMYPTGVHKFKRGLKEALLKIPGIDHAVEDE